MAYENLNPQLKYNTPDYFNMLSKLLPRGFIWVTRLVTLDGLLYEEGGTPPSTIYPTGLGRTWFTNLITCFASELYQFEQQVIALVRELVPGLSVDAGLLTRWEKIAGLPDDCQKAVGGALTEEERQIDVHTKLINSSQTVTIPYLEAYALNYGYNVTIVEKNTDVDSFIMGVSIMGVGVMGGAGENTVIEVTVVAGSGNLPLLQCNFRRLVPAHTVLVWVT